MGSFIHSTILALLVGKGLAASYNIPSSPPSGSSPQLDTTPLGISFEFFYFPGYMNTVSTTEGCLQHLSDNMGKSVPVRIGGSTADEATYISSQQEEVVGSINKLTYGPSYLSLAGTLEGETTLGLNRKDGNLSNTIAAAKVAKSNMKNLYAFELGNEPDGGCSVFLDYNPELGFYSAPVAKEQGGWSPADEAANERLWQKSVCTALGSTDLIQAGNYGSVNSDSIAELAPSEGSYIQYVRDFAGHLYPQTACDGKTTNLELLMSHSETISKISVSKNEVKAANAVGRPYYLGETNSATCGGGTISPTFGAALWVIDWTLSNLVIGVQRLYFHHGTLPNCNYCWFGEGIVDATYYGAFFVSQALGGADYVAMLDNGKTPYAVYAIYKDGKPVSVVLYNSDLYTGGTRSTQSFTLTGISAANVTAKRLTASSAAATTAGGVFPTFAGQTFANDNCALENSAVVETLAVSGGTVTISLGASEALLVSL